MANQAKRTVLEVIPLPYLPGYELRTVLLEYPPGGPPSVHYHPYPGINYLLEGTVTSQWENEPPVTFTAGQTFIDEANREHKVTNGSQTEGFKAVVTYAIKIGEPNVVIL